MTITSGLILKQHPSYPSPSLFTSFSWLFVEHLTAPQLHECLNSELASHHPRLLSPCTSSYFFSFSFPDSAWYVVYAWNTFGINYWADRWMVGICKAILEPALGTMRKFFWGINFFVTSLMVWDRRDVRVHQDTNTAFFCPLTCFLLC